MTESPKIQTGGPPAAEPLPAPPPPAQKTLFPKHEICLPRKYQEFADIFKKKNVDVLLPH